MTLLRSRLGFVALLSVLLPAPSSAAEAPLVLEATITLPDVQGRIDHMSVDLARGRVLIAELGNDTVDVVDLAGAQVIHRIGDLKEPQGVAYVPGMDLSIIN